jgi:hypothetical protein
VNKTGRLIVRATEEEVTRWKERARGVPVGLSEYVRRCVDSVDGEKARVVFGVGVETKEMTVVEPEPVKAPVKRKKAKKRKVKRKPVSKTISKPVVETPREVVVEEAVSAPVAPVATPSPIRIYTGETMERAGQTWYEYEENGRMLWTRGKS